MSCYFWVICWPEGFRPKTLDLSIWWRRREEAGLSEAELSLCSHACALPTGRLQPSMNLSHAAAVVLSQCFELRVAPDSRPAAAPAPAPAASAAAPGDSPAWASVLPASEIPCDSSRVPEVW